MKIPDGVTPEQAATIALTFGDQKDVKAVADKFKNFQSAEVLSLTHPGFKGVTEVAIRRNQLPSLAGLTVSGVKALQFYVFDPATNKYKTITPTNVYLDRNGFLHFTTDVEGYIVISDGKLAKK